MCVCVCVCVCAWQLNAYFEEQQAAAALAAAAAAPAAHPSPAAPAEFASTPIAGLGLLGSCHEEESVHIEVSDGGTKQTRCASARASVQNKVQRTTAAASRALEVETASRARTLVRQTTRMRLSLRKELRVDLGKSWWWSYKTFKLYPCIAKLRGVDEPARFLFPLGGTPSTC